MTRTALLRWMAVGLAVAAVQAIAVVAYVWVSRSREPVRAFEHDDIAPTRLVDLELEGARGRTARLASLVGRATLVHFWATWCAPCRTELPSLLGLDGETFGSRRVTVVAVSADDRWPAIDLFFGHRVPPTVWRGGPAASRAYGVRALPETYVVDAGRVLRARMRGPRDWSSPAARSALAGLLERAP